MAAGAPARGACAVDLPDSIRSEPQPFEAERGADADSAGARLTNWLHAFFAFVTSKRQVVGINFIDTADGYSNGESEEILGKALGGGRRKNMVLAVKYGGPLGDNPHTGASLAWTLQAVEGSRASTARARHPKLAAVDALAALADDAGLTLIQLAIAFAVRHPAVTSAIIGPRTMQHLDGYLAADGVTLSTEVLDRIDQIVPPGTSVEVADNMWAVGTRKLDVAARRR